MDNGYIWRSCVWSHHCRSFRIHAAMLKSTWLKHNYTHREVILQACCEVWSMHLASTLDYAKDYYRYWHSTYPHMKERLLVGVLLSGKFTVLTQTAHWKLQYCLPRWHARLVWCNVILWIKFLYFKLSQTTNLKSSILTKRRPSSVTSFHARLDNLVVWLVGQTYIYKNKHIEILSVQIVT